jgi:hypothetical protein
MAILGYARVSTDHQSLDQQRDALTPRTGRTALCLRNLIMCGSAKTPAFKVTNSLIFAMN